MHRSLTAVSLTLVAACADDPLPETAADTVGYVLAKTVREQDPGVVWDLLPASYRAELQGLARRVATAMPGASYDKFFQVIHRTGILLKSKGEELLAFGPLASTLGRMRTSEDAALDLFESAGNVLILLGQSEISSRQKLRTADLAQFVHETGRRLWTHGARAFAATGQTLAKRIEGLSYETVTAAGDRATLRFQFAGQSMRVGFQRVEGRWLPAPLVDRWQSLRAGVESFFAELQQPEAKQRLQEIEDRLDRLLADLGALQAAESRTAFANALEKIGLRYLKDLRQIIPLPR